MRREWNFVTSAHAHSTEAVRAALLEAAMLCGHPALADLGEPLHARAVRLERQTFTVALFGAFSAGKSSLANALLGAHVLPVSPQPTTAVVTRVLAPTGEYPNGAVAVHYKTADDCLAEGLPRIAPRAGHEVRMTVADLRQVVAREEEAVFVDRVDVHVAAPLTDAGVILVDTPGADSLHARHADVSFRYMRDADAMLYVTYYNHAFSASDRDMLRLLSLVQDARASDAVFFLVNAADLATGADELAEVLAHVRDHLVKQGVRRPDLMSVSSQVGLIARLRRATGAWSDGAERTLRQRLRLAHGAPIPPLSSLLREAGIDDLEQRILVATHGRLQEAAKRGAIEALEAAQIEIGRRLQAATAHRDGGRARYARLEAACEQAREAARESCASLASALTEEIDELLHYVRQRLTFGHERMVAEAFHPSAIERGTESELHDALRAWLGALTVAAGQEWRATLVRLERVARGLLNGRLERVAGRLPDARVGPLIEPPEYPPLWTDPLATPAFLPDAHLLRVVQQTFRGPQAFFEQGGRRVLAQQLRAPAEVLAAAWLDGRRNEALARCNEWVTDSCALLAQHTTASMETILAAARAVLADDGAPLHLGRAFGQWPRLGAAE